MFKKKDKEKINYEDLNEMLALGKTILKIVLVTIIIVGVYLVLMVLKVLGVKHIIGTIVTVLSPLFIGIIIAWLLNPIVNYLEKRGIRRIIGIILAYIVLIFILSLIISALIPLIYSQIIDFSNSLPAITQSISNFIDNLFNKLGSIQVLDVEKAKSTIYSMIAGYGFDITESLPQTLISGTLSFISGVGNFLIGLVISFFLLLGFNNITDTFLIVVPKKYHYSANELINKINKSLRAYVNGSLFDAIIIFVACSIAFAFTGLKAPILFALFCGLMNVIPYAGPYIGAIPALIVGFSQGTGVGIGVGLSIVIIQSLEGNILSPIVMSKTTKLHPVTIIVGLLVFGHFFGMVGMLLSTPIISVLKAIIEFINSKYHIFKEIENEEKIDEEQEA